MTFLRFIVLLVSTACLTQLQTNLSIQKFASNCVDEEIEHDAPSNRTIAHSSFLEMAPAFGMLAGLLPIAVTLQVHSKKRVFLVVGALSTAATAIVPLCERVGFSFHLIARIMQGVGLAITYPMIATVTWEWAALGEHGLFLAVLTGFPQLSSLLLTPVAGTMCDGAFGMRGIYSFASLTGLVFFTLFAFFYQDSPQAHPMISKEELQYIKNEKEEACLTDVQPESAVPFRDLFSSKTIWACWLSGMAEIFITAFFSRHFANFQNFDAGTMGLLLLLLCFRVLAGCVSDAARCISETNKLRAFNTVAFGAPALLFVTLQFVPFRGYAVTVLMIASCLLGLSASGFYKCITLHTRQHAHTVMIVMVLIHAFCSLIFPPLFTAFSLLESPSSWGSLASIIAVLQLLATLAFFICANAEPAECTRIRTEEKKSDLDLIEYWQE